MPAGLVAPCTCLHVIDIAADEILMSQTKVAAASGNHKQIILITAIRQIEWTMEDRR